MRASPLCAARNLSRFLPPLGGEEIKESRRKPRAARPVWLPIVRSDRQKTRLSNARYNFVNCSASPPFPPPLPKVFFFVFLSVFFSFFFFFLYLFARTIAASLPRRKRGVLQFCYSNSSKGCLLKGNIVDAFASCDFRDSD